MNSYLGVQDDAETTRPGARSTSPKTVQVVHFGPQGEMPGGIAQVINSYCTWKFETVEVSGVRTTYGKRNRKDPIRFAASVRRLMALRLKKKRSLAIFHMSQRGSFVREGSLVILSRALGIPTAVQLHGSEFPAHADRHPRTTAWVLTSAHAVFTLTDKTSSAIKSVVRSPQDVRVIQIKNAVEIGERPCGTTRTNSIVMAGELGRRKGVDVAIRAWRQLGECTDGWVLQLIGPRQSDISEWPDLPRLEYAGVESHQRLMDRLCKTKIALLPARHEAMPMFILEAMAAGCAIISTPVGQIPEVVTADVGILVGTDDATALADAIQMLIADESRLSSMSRSSIGKIEASYSSEKMAQKLELEWLAIINAFGK